MVQNKLKWAAGVVLVACVGRGGNRAVGIGRRAGIAATPHEPSNCPRNPARRRPTDGATVPREQTRSRSVTSLLRDPLLDRSGQPAAALGWHRLQHRRCSRYRRATRPVAGKQYVVSRPVGTWSREVVPPNGNGEDSAASIGALRGGSSDDPGAGIVERQPVETVLEADYSITSDSVVFGVVTGLTSASRLACAFRLARPGRRNNSSTSRLVSGSALTTAR